MPISVERICQALEEIAPKRLAEDWDNVGLLIGSPSEQVDRVLLCLDVTPKVVEHAVKNGFRLIVSHHPVIFRPLKAIRQDLAQGSLITTLIQNNIAVYTAHTNWDMAAHGTSHALARALGVEGASILSPKGRLKLYKVVVFTPDTHKQDVFDAMAKAGAGHIGNYSHCSFQTQGMGTFLPLDGSSPFVGTQGLLEEVQETRLEMIVPESSMRKVVNAMLKAHPYEEVAYDVIDLHNGGADYGLGKIGVLSQPVLAAEFLQTIKRNFPQARLCGKLPTMVKKIAVCGGSGADLLHAAKSRGADVLITGDVGYHVALEASMQGIAVIDAGHYETEVCILDDWKNILTDMARTVRAEVVFDTFKNNSGPFSGLEVQ